MAIAQGLHISCSYPKISLNNTRSRTPSSPKVEQRELSSNEDGVAGAESADALPLASSDGNKSAEERITSEGQGEILKGSRE
jgi:hypothetical protein